MTIKQKIQNDGFRKILKINKVKKIALFGSHAKGQAHSKSDIDFLVDFDKNADLFDQIGLKDDLHNYFKKNVDIVTRSSLNKYIRVKILKEAILL
jgi:predicted nucleotidyltransferase